MWWFKYAFSSLAPYLDFQLVKNLCVKKINDVAAENALNKLELHLRFLTQAIIPLVLVDVDVLSEEKDQNTAAMLQYTHFTQLQISDPSREKKKIEPNFFCIVKPDVRFPALLLFRRRFVVYRKNTKVLMQKAAIPPKK